MMKLKAFEMFKIDPAMINNWNHVAAFKRSTGSVNTIDSINQILNQGK